MARARRRNREAKASAIQAALREQHLGLVAAAYAATTVAHAKLLIALNEQTAELEGQVKVPFLAHPDAEIHLSMPGIAEITGARVLAEFGDDRARSTSAKARKNYAGTSPTTRALRQSDRLDPPRLRPSPCCLTTNDMGCPTTTPALPQGGSGDL